MGWFLSSKKTKSKSKSNRSRRGKKKSAEPRFDLQRVRPVVQTIAVTGSLIAGYLLWDVGEQSLRTYVTQRSFQPVQGEQIALSDAPPWIAGWIEMQLKRQIAAQVSGDPLDGSGLERAATVLADDPWIVRVKQIRRLPGSMIDVQAEYRMPIALVESVDGYHIVSTTGVLLPGLYMPEQIEAVGLPIIAGVDVDAPRPGQPWESDRLAAGIQLVSLLDGEPYFQQIEAFDVSGDDGRGRIQLSLLTHTGGKVIWGLPPRQEASLEPEASLKRDKLRSIYGQRGSIDAGSRTVAINEPGVMVYPHASENQQASAGYTIPR